MGKYVLTFVDIKIEKNKFCCHKTPIFKKDVDLHNDDKVRPLHIMLTKKNTYINSYNGITKWKYFWLNNLIANLSIIKRFKRPK